MLTDVQRETAEKIYRNDGNRGVIDLVDREATTVLDVGCGAGDNAALLRRRDPHKRIYGITGSEAERSLALRHLDDCWVVDLEAGLPPQVTDMTFDCAIFSHVLEHLRSPATLLGRIGERLVSEGTCIIAVPNLANWRERLKLLEGRFDYEETGVRDTTHLRFFTFHTVIPQLLGTGEAHWRVEHHSATGHVPLWMLRRRLLPAPLRRRIDQWGCQWRPNLFGEQILLKLRRQSGPITGATPQIHHSA